MNIVVIGLGSMGKRRIRLIHEMYSKYSIFGVDSRKDRRDEVNEMFSIDSFTCIDEAEKEIRMDCAFVCTPPLSHNAIIKECLKKGWNVFTELNLVSDGYVSNVELAKENGCVLFLSSTFLYREEIRFIQNEVNKGDKWNYIYHIGQYLPDWHPWESYKDFFVGDFRTNGCREILAIELPWLTETFGKIIDNHVISDKITTLDIDYNDNYIIQFTHENGNKGVLIVDVVSPYAVRRFEAYSENHYLQWNGTPDTLYEFNHEDKGLVTVHLHERTEHIEGYCTFVVENAYKNEISKFFEVVNKGGKQLYGFDQDLEILNLIDILEGSV